MEPSGDILIADNDPAIHAVIRQFLRHTPNCCECVSGAAELLEQLRQQPFDLLIADTSLAGDDGLEVIQQAKSLASSLPVILMDALPTVATVAAAINLGVSAYLYKPFNGLELLEQVDKAVYRGQLARATASLAQRSELLCRELTDLHSALTNAPTVSADVAGQALLASVLGNVLDNFKILMETAGALPANANGSSGLNAQLLQTQRTLLMETSHMLESTKTAFKSRDLGALRKKIDQFLKNS